MSLKEGRSKARWNIFRDKEMEFQFMRSMAVMSEGGAEIGECLLVKLSAKDGGMDSLSEAWRNQAQNVEADAERFLELNAELSARSSFLRASNYYRSAMTCLSPLNKMHFENWKKQKSALRGLVRFLTILLSTLLFHLRKAIFLATFYNLLIWKANGLH